MRRLLHLTVAAIVAAIPIIAVGSTARAAVGSAARARTTVGFTAQLDGQPIDLSSTGDPIIVDPDRNSTLSLHLRNDGSDPVTVRQLQIRGRVFGITLMAYDVTINALLPAGARTSVAVPVEFVDLGQQADGLLPATMRLVSPGRAELASENFTVEVRGSPTSVMTIFTLVVAIATALSVGAIWIAVGRRRVPPNRFRRGLRFGVTGAGVGVTLTLFLSELLLVSPKGTVWIPLLLAPTLGAFALGYVSPGPLALEAEEEEEVEDWMRATALSEPASGGDSR